MSTALMRRYITSDELPLSWQKEIDAKPKELFYITINKAEPVDYDDDGNPMPPESQISEKLVKAVEVSDASYKKGNFTRCSTKEENDAFFKAIWSEEAN
ncbi:MAG: hypothetical protein HQK71_08095 [Desulfamplus sp.]|nr:hypothetical protein [Desulfamplus sp.]